MQADFWGGFCDDQETAETIKKTFNEYGYLCDTHTAVAVKVYQDYTAQTGDKTKCIIASTASPYKFNDAVLAAITDEAIPADPFEQAEMLSRISGTTPPASLMELKTKKVRFTDSVEKQQMVEKVKEMLK